MADARAVLVLAAWPSPPSIAGWRITDDPALLRDASDVLLDDVVLPDRYVERRYASAEQDLVRVDPARLPTEAADYANAFIQADVDLSARLDRMRKTVEGRPAGILAVPAVEDRYVWAAAHLAKERGLRLERYPVAGRSARAAGAPRRRLARLGLTVLSPMLFARYRRTRPRILTTDLGLLDPILPYLGDRPGALSTGLGVAGRLRHGEARFAWLRHTDPDPVFELSSRETMAEAALALALGTAPDLPEIARRAREIFAAGAVDAVVLSDDKAPVNRALVRLASDACVPSLVVQHGITGHPIGFLPLHADRFAAWGERCARWLADRGMPRDRISVVGDPRYDRVFRSREDLRWHGRELLRSRGTPEDARVVVLFSQPAEGRLDALRLVLAGIEGLPFRLVVKVHPAERVSFYEAAAAREGASVPVFAGEPDPLLCAADVVLTQSSGLAVVAAQLGTPVVLLEPHILENIDAYDGQWPRAVDARSLRNRLEAVRDGSYDFAALRALGQEYGGPPDGKAGERVAELIRRMVEG